MSADRAREGCGFDKGGEVRKVPFASNTNAGDARTSAADTDRMEREQQWCDTAYTRAPGAAVSALVYNGRDFSTYVVA